MTDSNKSDNSASPERPGSSVGLRAKLRSFNSNTETGVFPITVTSEGDTHDPCQDLSKEIVDLIREQRYEERMWNEEERRLGYETLRERERMSNEARFQELKTNIKIMENGIRTSYIKSSRALFRMDNGELRTHFVLCEDELGGKLEKLELELLHCNTTASLLGRDCAVTKQIVKECKTESEVMVKYLKDLMGRRQVSRTKPVFSEKKLPRFNGVWHSGNVFDFKQKLLCNLGKMEVPRSDWTFWILSKLSGPAIVTVKDCLKDLCMAEWDQIMDTLVENFGDARYLHHTLICQHKSAGRLAEIFPNTNLKKRGQCLRKHLRLIGEALELHCDHQREVIDHSYSSTVISMLAPSDRMYLRENNLTWECLNPFERVLAVQKKMKAMLEYCMAEAELVDAELTPGFDFPSDDPDDSDKNPLFLNS